jgi:hypothetical protein
MLFRHPKQTDNILRIAADAGGILTYLGLAWGVNNEGALRYACPFLIALASSRLLFPLSGRSITRTPHSTVQVTAQAPRAFIAAVAAMQLGLVVIFAQHLLDRITRIATQHMVISFPLIQPLRDYETQALGDRARNYVRAVQAKAPPGTKIWAWVDTPFHFDFARNQIWYFYHSWFVAPWRLGASTSENLRQELAGRGVDYILWQYRTPLISKVPILRAQLQSQLRVEDRILSENTLALLLALEGLATPFDTVYNDGTSVLIRIGRPSQ